MKESKERLTKIEREKRSTWRREAHRTVGRQEKEASMMEGVKTNTRKIMKELYISLPTLAVAGGVCLAT